MAIKWTVGMAVYDTGVGGYEAMRAAFTAMSLSIHHPFIGEILVVDNSPQPYSSLKTFLGKIRNCRYVSMPEPVGTSPPRNRVFEEAQCDYVMCLDAHVLLYPGTFESLTGFYARVGLDNADLLHGPLMTEKGTILATHLNDEWRADMLGTWGLGWLSHTGRMFSCVENGPKVRYVTLGQEEGEQRPLTPEEVLGYKLPPDVDWAGHERKLIAAGCTLPTSPFAVPGHGMGMFACRKDAWLPFHPAARGFGGEEITTGYRYRQAGRKCWCIPGAKWWHHFEKGPYAGGTAYPLMLSDRVRNYVLEFCRLGLSLDPIKHHFELRVPPHEWPALLRGDRLQPPPAFSVQSSLTQDMIEPASSSK